MSDDHWTLRGGRLRRWLSNLVWEVGDRIVGYRWPWERRR